MINYRPATLAQRVPDIPFEQWKHRPGYRAHCYTNAMAHEICGVRFKPGPPQIEAMATFRCLAPFRDDSANELRTRVARHIKALRREAFLVV